MIQIKVGKSSAIVTARETVVSGAVNVYDVSVSFSEAWDDLTKTAVFSAGGESRSVLMTDTVVRIPWEVLENAGRMLSVGFIGTSGTEVVLPTVQTEIGMILEGTGMSEAESEPTPGIYEQILSVAESVRDDADAGEFRGETGKSAYEAAIEAGYEGTETEFSQAAADLAENAKNAAQSAASAAASALEAQTITSRIPNIPLVKANTFTASATQGIMTEQKVNVRTGASSSTNVTIPIANSTKVGLMTPDSVNAIQSLTSRVAALEGQTIRIAYTDSTSPSASDILSFMEASSYPRSVWAQVAVVVVDTPYVWRWMDGTAWQRFTDTVGMATGSTLGIVKGDDAAGKIHVEDNGTMSLNGYDSIQTALGGKANTANLTHETWTFYLADNTSVTKEAVLWLS